MGWIPMTLTREELVKRIADTKQAQKEAKRHRDKLRVKLYRYRKLLEALDKILNK
jgi:alkanesulfonate monooxygenase SsuD/methylene tetrahydromethanopterin reductase-like flavin-dependent oxidoreductase (luciferase family)